MSHIELFSNKEENELMVNVVFDPATKELEIENIYVYIPFSDMWLDIDYVNNEKAHKRATQIANGLFESYLMNQEKGA